MANPQDTYITSFLDKFIDSTGCRDLCVDISKIVDSGSLTKGFQHAIDELVTTAVKNRIRNYTIDKKGIACIIKDRDNITLSFRRGINMLIVEYFGNGEAVSRNFKNDKNTPYQFIIKYIINSIEEEYQDKIVTKMINYGEEDQDTLLYASSAYFIGRFDVFEKYNKVEDGKNVRYIQTKHIGAQDYILTTKIEIPSTLKFTGIKSVDVVSVTVSISVDGFDTGLSFSTTNPYSKIVTRALQICEKSLGQVILLKNLGKAVLAGGDKYVGYVFDIKKINMNDCTADIEFDFDANKTFFDYPPKLTVPMEWLVPEDRAQSSRNFHLI